MGEFALVFILAVAVIYLLVAMSRAKSRISYLENRYAKFAKADVEKTDTSKATAAKPPSPVKAPKPTSIIAETTQASDVVASGPWEKVAETATPEPETGPKPEPSGETEIDQPSTPQTVVFTADRVAAVSVWLGENWFLAVAALSLALSGIFLVQYGVENGLITPVWRVAGAAALGLALVVAGEVIRRRYGDAETGSPASAAFLPSTFSGAGLVVLFVAALAAHHLYGLIGPGASFAWLIIVAALGVALGWFYGPYLTLVGLAGAIMAPFLVGGSSNNPELFYYFFGLVAVVALLIDAIRRWAWVSVLGLGGAFLASTYIFSQGAADEHYIVFAFVMVLAAVIIPPLKLTPNHGGTTTIQALLGSNSPKSWPEFPTRIAIGTIVAATLAALSVAMTGAGVLEVWLALACILSVFAIVVFWSRTAEALSDGALLALPAFLTFIATQKAGNGTLYREFISGLASEPETAMPLDASALVIMGSLVSAIALWRGLFSGLFARVWAGGAALAAPVVVLMLEATWRPSLVLSDYVWALHAMAVAALMVFGATTVARRDGEDHERASYFALSAAVMIALAVVILFSQTALTLAIAALVFGAAYIDRVLNLRHLTLFAAVGIVAIGWRLVVDPGIIDAPDMPYWEVVLVYGGSIIALAGAWKELAPRNRWQVQIMAASAAWSAVAILATVVLAKVFDDLYDSESSLHWQIGLMALVWLSSSAVQLWRLKIGGVRMTRVRLGLAGLFGLIGLAALGVALVAFAFMVKGLAESQIVRGPYVIDTLMLALGLPAFLFAVISIQFNHLPRWMRLTAGGASGALATLYVGLEIRRFWQGDHLGGAEVLDGELYSYTVAMLIGATGLLFAAFFRRSSGLRQVAVAVIALTIAKVFLIDMSGLTGLIRVASFLGLGLSMAGLAWVVRMMNAQWELPDTESALEAEDD